MSRMRADHLPWSINYHRIVNDLEFTVALPVVITKARHLSGAAS